MKQILPFKTLFYLTLVLISVTNLFSQVDPTNPNIRNTFNVKYNGIIRGDMTLISNNILSKIPTNVAYNLVGNTSDFNDNVNQQFIDIDGNATTFNSSSANLTIPDPNCSRIVHAGLYWSATYLYNIGNDPASGRSADWNKVKFRIPGGTYQDITATEVLYNSNIDTNQTNVAHGPYACYADVTTIVAANVNPNGTYFTANIQASLDGRGSTDGINTSPFRVPGGAAGGWTLVLVYENINLPSKKITTFDGYAVIASNAGALNIPISGFETLPAPTPVRAKIGLSSIEGDNRITGDGLRFKANSLANFTPLNNTPAPALPPAPPNYFSSTITLDGVFNLNRNPASINTLGWDAHLNAINNPLNSVIPNSETGCVLEATSTADKYDLFLTTFDVEVIEPDIPIVKTVRDLAGVDISNVTLALGQEFYYNLNFKNIGNDNAINFIITDNLPINLIFPANGGLPILGVDLIIPPGSNITYTYNPTTKSFVFTIPNLLVRKNTGLDYNIKIRVRAPRDCNDIVDSCQNIIRNQANGTYTGDENPQTFTDNLSYNNGNICQFPNPAATNTLPDISNCNYSRTEVLCGNTLLITGPTGYTSYSWTNGTGQVIGTTQNITVTSIGVYSCAVTIPNPCASFNLTVTVVDFDDAPTVNPLSNYSNFVICPNNGIKLTKIILCGSEDHELIETGITNATNIIWERFTEGSCPTALINQCPNTNPSPSCTWTQVGTGPNYDATTAGQYRITIFYQNGCFRPFFFNVYKNQLSPTIVPKNIVCTTPGSITINNTSAGYLYSLNPTGPFVTTNVFPITVAGQYTVYIKQSGIDTGCTFEYPVSITSTAFTVDIIKTDKVCNNGFGSIRVQMDNVPGQFYFQLLQGATVLNSAGPIGVNNYLFTNLNPGIYTVRSSTDDGCLDIRTVEILNGSNLSLTAQISQNITCTQGNILVNPSGGQPPYNFAIYSYSGTVVLPANYVFQTSRIFDIQIGDQGTYQFIVVDSNNCTSISEPVTINLEPPVPFSETHTNVTCNGLANGSITMSTGSLNGYSVSYSIDGTTFQNASVFSPLATGTYTITVKFKKGNRECIYSIVVTITQPPALNGSSELIQQKTCLINGSIHAINVSGGTAPYQYSINGTTYQASPIFANLGVGTYTIIIRDANLCTKITTPIQIIDAIAPTALTLTNSALSCPNLTTTITATVVGGTAPYTFQIIAPSLITATTTSGTIATFSNLSSGSYTVKVTDSKGCVFQQNITIAAVVPITLSGNVTSNVGCINTATGSATFTVGGFNTTYTYSVNNGIPFANQTATTITLPNLASGSYIVKVTDSQTNCFKEVTVTIASPPALLQLTAPFSPKTCINNGSLNATATGGWGSYQFTLTLPDGTIVGPQNNGIFGDLSQTGTYTIKVKDANSCEVSNTFTINGTTNPDLNIDLIESNFCIINGAGASITATASSGTAPYQYQINNGALQNSPVFNNLTPNTYTIKVIDAFGCEATISQVINPVLTAAATLIKAIDCSTNANATITVNINGGIAAYQYQIKFNGGSFGALTPVTGTSFNYSTLIDGTYQFQITDAQGCVFVTNVITVSPITTPNIISVTQTPPDCNGGNNGTLTVNINPSLGTGPFSYNINNGTYQLNNPLFTGLTAGTYTVGVRDSKLCTDTEVIILLQPNLLAGQSQLVQELTCIITTGTIQAINVSGGTTPYQYSINGINFQNSPIFSGLAAGDYTIIIKDAKNCSITTAMIPLTVPQPPTNLSFTTSAVTCPALTSTITATVVGGLAPFTFQIIAPSIINASTTIGATATFTNLAVGTYTIKVTDSKGCTYQENKTIDAISQISIIGNATNVRCFGSATGSATYTVSGFSSTYSYTLNNGTPITNQTGTSITLTNLIAGTYEIVVKDNITNCTATKILTVQNPTAALTLNIPFTPKTCIANGSLSATAIGGWGSNQFTLTQPNGVILGPQNTGVFANLSQTGLYTVKVVDANNCEVTDTFTINPTSNPALNIDAGASDLCINTSAGASITVIASGGVPGYQYQINNGQLQNSPIFNNLIAGSYTIKVIDSFGCEDTVTQIINPTLTSLAVLDKAIDCSTTAAANIIITIAGGVAPYQYQIKFNTGAFGALNPVVGSTFNYNTSIAGTYQFQITDAQGCIFVTNVITVDPITNPEITGLVLTQPILCNGNLTGEIVVGYNTGLGTVPFEYSLNGGAFQSLNIFSNLPAGSYTVVMKDANECTDTASITITQPAIVDFDLTKTNLTCSGVAGAGNTLGTITVSNIVGGTQPYEYILRNITFQVIANYFPLTNENYTFPNVDFGNYSVEVIDTNGCSKIKFITIASPPNSLITTNATSNCLTGGTVQVTVLAVVPGSNYEFGILVIGDAPYANTFQPADIPGGTVSTFTNLIPGLTYTFVVHDITSDCYFIQEIPTVIPPSSSIVTTVGVVQNITCVGSSDGNVSFSMTNFSATPTPTTSVSYEIFENTTNTTTGFTGTQLVSGPTAIVNVNNLGLLTYGSYYILITENGGCTATSPVFTISESTKLLEVTANLIQNDNCNTNGGIVSALGQFGSAPYTFQITTATAVAPNVSNWAGTATSTFNVEAGSYIVYIRDANNCIQASTPVNVGLTLSPSISLSLVAPCVNEGLFEVNVTVTNDNSPPFTYVLDSNAPVVQNNPNFTISNLLSGIHTVTFTDANGCFDTKTITINQTLSGNVIATNQPSCANNDGAIDANAINGSGSYSFILQNSGGTTIQGPNNDGIFTGLGHGTYTVIVTDININPLLNCSIPLTIPLEQPIPVTLLPTTFENPKCNGESNGSITVNLAPGNNNIPYTYVLTAAGFTTVTQIGNPIFTGLSQNNYTITVTSERGCVGTDTVPLVAPSVLTIAPTGGVFGCNANNTSTVVTITIPIPTTGTAPYLYSFDGLNYSNTRTFDLIDNGTSQPVTGYVKDANGCIASNIITIEPLVKITSTSVSLLSPYSCVNTQDIIQIEIFGGVGPYNYQLLPSATTNPITGNTFSTSLTVPGTYVYQINDTGTNCSVTTIPCIFAPLNVLSVVATPGTPIACFGNSSELSFTVNGYTGNYTYDIVRGDGTFVVQNVASTSVNNPETYSGLAAGSYSVIVSIPTINAYVSCNATSNIITITQPLLPLSLLLTKTNDRDCLTNSGTITATATDGTAPYLYQLSNAGGILQAFSSDNTFQDLANGLYTVSVTDANNCPFSDTITVGLDPKPLIDIALLNPCANEGLYTIRVNRTQDGVAPYSYMIDGNTAAINNTTPFDLTNLLSGNHSVQIIDANGCGETETITITPKAIATVIIESQPSCTAGGSIKTIVTGGTGTFIYTLQNSSGTTLLTSPDGIFNSPLLVPGLNYTVTVTDTNLNGLGTNCTTIVPFDLETPAAVTFSLETVQPSCSNTSTVINNGSINVVLGAGNTNPLYTYTLTDGINAPVVQNNPLFTGLAGSITGITYTITVTSERGCFDTQTTTLTNTAPLSVAAIVPGVFDCGVNSVLTLTVPTPVGGTPPYTYSFNGSGFSTTNTYNVVDTNATQPIIVTVRDDKTCEVSQTITFQPLNSFTISIAQGTNILTCSTAENVKISIVGGSGNFTYQLLPSGAVTAVTTNPIQTTLTAAGTYVYEIKDTTTGCTKLTAPYTILPLSQFDVIATAGNPLACFGDTNGTLSFVVNGYTGNFTFDVVREDGTIQSSGTNANTNVTGLTIGNYTVNVTIPNTNAYLACTKISNVISITAPSAALDLTISQTSNVTCNNDSGTILAIGSGGTLQYQYQLEKMPSGAIEVAFGNQSSFAGLAAGDYKVKIKDANNCATEKLITLLPTTPITVINPPAITNQLLKCFGISNASVTITGVSGGEGSYQYTLTNTVTGSVAGPSISNTFNNLGFGNYSIVVTDGWGCSSPAIPFTIDQPNEIVATLTTSFIATCTAPAQLTIVVTGGTPPYKYSTDNITYVAIPSSITVAPGNYSYYVTDANDCKTFVTNDVTIDPIFPVVLELNLNNTFINCAGDTNASVEATATLGLGNYSFSLLNSASNVIQGPQASGLFAGAILAPGNYFIKVTSGGGICDAVKPFSITVAPALVVPAATVVNVKCNGDSTGSITVNASGGTTLYQYAINPEDLSQTSDVNQFSNLKAGDYEILVQDANGCFRIITARVEEPDALTVNSVEQQEFCTGAGGSSSVTIGGGTAPFFVSFNNETSYIQIPSNGNQYTIPNITGGQEYTIFIKDANNCTTNKTITMNAPVTITPQITPVTYGCTTATSLVNNSVSVSISESAIANQIQYSLDNNTSYQPNGIFSNLTNGLHTIYVKHSNGCEKTITVNITNTLPLNATKSRLDVKCFGDNTGSFTLSGMIGGSGSYQYAISPLFVFGTTATFTGLVAGTYTIKMKDMTIPNCAISFTETILNTNSVVSPSVVLVDQPICFGDGLEHIQINVTGGVAPYLTSLNGTANYIANQLDFYDNLNIGSTPNIIFVKDALGCEKQISVLINAGVRLNPIATPAETCINNIPTNSVTVSMTPDYPGDVQYALNNGTTTGLYQISNVFSNLPPGNYTIKVLHDNGCSKSSAQFNVKQLTNVQLTATESGLNQITATATLGQPPYTYEFNGVNTGQDNVYFYTATGNQNVKVYDANGCFASRTVPTKFYDIEIPNFFTPNGSGQNDGWTPLKIDNLKNIKTSIFDRYGRELKILYNGNQWDGTYRGNQVPSGDYWYLVEVNDNTGRTFVGNFTLYR